MKVITTGCASTAPQIRRVGSELLRRLLEVRGVGQRQGARRRELGLRTGNRCAHGTSTIANAFGQEHTLEVLRVVDVRGGGGALDIRERAERVRQPDCRFYAGNSFTRRPRRLRLEGSQNGESWKVLLESEELTWESGGYGEWKEWRLSNQESFHAYQLVGNGCGSEGIEFAEVLLFADRVNVACAAVDGFPAANEGEESHGPCPSS